MKKILIIITCSLLSATYSLAQNSNNSTPLTRAQVKQDLKDVEAAGYNPATSNDPEYPQDIQKAEKKVEQKKYESNNPQ